MLVSPHMKLHISMVVILWLALAGQASAQARPKTAGEAFKNVTTSALKDLTVDDFIGAMGVMAAGLGYDCADCHRNAGYDTVNWADDSMTAKEKERKMINMVT